MPSKTKLWTADIVRGRNGRVFGIIKYEDLRARRFRSQQLWVLRHKNDILEGTRASSNVEFGRGCELPCVLRVDYLHRLLKCSENVFNRLAPLAFKPHLLHRERFLKLRLAKPMFGQTLDQIRVLQLLIINFWHSRLTCLPSLRLGCVRG